MQDWDGKSMDTIEAHPALVEAERKIIEQKQAIVQRQEGFVPASTKVLPSPSLAEETDTQRVERLKSEWAKVKEDEKKKLASYWASRSWQAWNWNQLIESWEMTKGKSVLFKARIYLLKFIDIVWDFLPFFLMAWELFKPQSLVFIALIIMVMLYFALTGMFVAAEYVRLSRVLVPIILPFALFYLWYAKIDLLQTTVSLLLFFMLVVALEVFLRDFYLLVSPSYLAVFVEEVHQRRLIRLQGVVENKGLNDPDLVANENGGGGGGGKDASRTESSPLLGAADKSNSCFGVLQQTLNNKVLPYLRTNTLLHILPYTMMIIMGAGSVFTALASSVVTTCLYSARYVATTRTNAARLVIDDGSARSSTNGVVG